MFPIMPFTKIAQMTAQAKKIYKIFKRHLNAQSDAVMASLDSKSLSPHHRNPLKSRQI